MLLRGAVMAVLVLLLDLFALDGPVQETLPVVHLTCDGPNNIPMSF